MIGKIRSHNPDQVSDIPVQHLKNDHKLDHIEPSLTKLVFPDEGCWLREFFRKLCL